MGLVVYKAAFPGKRKPMPENDVADRHNHSETENSEEHQFEMKGELSDDQLFSIEKPRVILKRGSESLVTFDRRVINHRHKETHDKQPQDKV